MRLAFLSALAPAILTAGAAAQSTSFTYQGRLKNGAQPASGLHDFRFTLFNAVSGGAQLAPPVCVDNVAVTDGLFTTTLDFGQQFVTTEARFLQIEVRADSGLTCVNPGGFTGLTPRQPLTPTPTATHAKTAFSLAAADGSPATAVFVDNDGQVGIGTLVPTTSLNVQAPTSGATPGAGIRIQGTAADVSNLAYLDFYNSAGARMGYVGDGGGADNSIYIQSDSANVHLYTQFGAALTAMPSGNIGIGTTTPTNRLSVAGNAGVTGSVGIGTSAPLAKLDVRGDIRLGGSGQFLAPAAQENLRLLRGNISGSGTILAGAGFTCVRAGEGLYEITFSPPFGGVPTVTTVAEQVWGDALQWSSTVATTLTASSVRIVTQSGSTTRTDSNFSICVIGPR